MHNVVNGKSNIGILHMLNKTPMDWYSRNTSTVETSTYGTEFCAARISVDQIIDFRYSLRMLGVPLINTSKDSTDDEPSWMFGDNLSVVNSSTLPSGKLLKRNHILNYHRVRQAQACGICNFIHMDGDKNPSDILTKYRSSHLWYPLMKPFLFWRERTGKE